MKRKPYLIVIAGPSCSGKTTIAERLAERLSPDRTTRLSLDAYYVDVSGGTPDAILHHNFDDPAALDGDLFVEHITALARGESIDKPVYDMRTHGRLIERETIEPREFVIIEGLHALYWDAVRAMARTRIYVDAPHGVCLERRLRRDLEHRNRNEEEVRFRYANMVRPMCDTYVAPCREYADAVVSGERPAEQSVETIIDHIRKNTGGGE